MVKVLSGHTSAETAYVVSDYPYSFNLRCQMRYWLEYKAKKGVRMVTQTSNPKRGGWNNPKASTYWRFGAALYVDDNGHVQQAGLSEYSDGAECTAFLATYEAGIPADMLNETKAWTAAKVAYDGKRAAAKANGVIPPLVEGLKEARTAFVEQITACTIEVFDERPHIPGNPVCIGTHANVPGTWSVADTVDRLGNGGWRAQGDTSR